MPEGGSPMGLSADCKVELAIFDHNDRVGSIWTSGAICLVHAQDHFVPMLSTFNPDEIHMDMLARRCDTMKAEN